MNNTLTSVVFLTDDWDIICLFLDLIDAWLPHWDMYQTRNITRHEKPVLVNIFKPPNMYFKKSYSRWKLYWRTLLFKNEPPYTNEGRNEPYCFLTGSEIKASLFLPDAVN